MKKIHEIQKLLGNSVPIWGYNPQGLKNMDILLSISRNSGIGLFNTATFSIQDINEILIQISQKLDETAYWGILIHEDSIIPRLIFPSSRIIVICSFSPSSANLSLLQQKTVMIGAEVLTTIEAKEKSGWADFFLVRGNEAGGVVSNINSFIQIQEFHKMGYSFIIEGGFGIFNVGAALVGGAFGVVFESQLYLLKESPLSSAYKSYLVSLQENDFYLAVENEMFNYRLIGKLANKSIRKIKAQEKAFYQYLISQDENMSRNFFEQHFNAYLDKIFSEKSRIPDWTSDNPKHAFMPCDHGIIFARYVAECYEDIAGFIQGLKNLIKHQYNQIKTNWPFQECSPIAQLLNIKYPIIQGPMANITESLEYAQVIAENGALPTFALGGLMDHEADLLLQKVSQSPLQNKSYMAGIIGLEVVKKRRNAQLESIKKYKVPFTLIAAGSVELAKQVIRQGERVFLHTPALSMFREAIKNGIEFMILEGSECGGHIGTLSSWVLWENVLEYCVQEKSNLPERMNVIFAGGIIDSNSSTMVAMLLGEHLDQINPAIQMGTAYLFTQEIVTSKALSYVYQNLLLDHQTTRVIGATVNTRARVIPSLFTYLTIKKEFERITQNLPISKRKDLYEKDNLGALRIAAQGEIWNAKHVPGTGTTQFLPISPEKQKISGAFMTGEIISLRNSVVSVKNLHYDIVKGGFHHLSDEFLKRFTSSTKTPHIIQNREIIANQEISIDSRVAIVGLGGVFPDSNNITEFWQNILMRKYSISEVPSDRWDAEIYYSSNKNEPDKTYTKIGGFIKNFQFKPIKFRIPPQMAARMDPVQKWALTAAKEALLDAKFPVDGKKPINLAVILGNSLGGEIQRTNDKRVLIQEIKHIFHQAKQLNMATTSSLVELQTYLENELIKDIPPINEDTMPGELSNIIAGRICNIFNLNGKNLTTDAACASSLAALDTAVKGLLFGDYDAVLAGGADRSMDPAVFIKFSKIGALSAKKSCPFDAEADGFVMGEGAGFVVLKRLSDAIRDNDKIYAVIRGIGSSSDGRGKGITAPNPQGQQNAILRAYNAAKISIDDIQYIECHGTSTVIGDAAELKVLQDILKNKGGNQKIAIGSVKSQIGHLKSAAAIAALIKTSLALYHKTIPPSVNFNTPNPKIDWEKAPFYVNTQTQPWELSESSIRRAGVSAFGFGGTNFHVVLEEYSPQNLDFPKISLPVYHPNENFPSLSQPINNFSEINEDLSLVLMFSGQGSQFVGMGKELYQKIPVIREVLDQANNISQNFGNFDLLKIMFGDPKRSLEENQKILTQTQFTQPAIFSLEIALYRYLTQKGLSPGIVAGHSLGEYSALVASGVIDFEHAMKAVIIRGKAMSEASSEISCGMAALLCSPEQAGKIISQINKGFVSISNYNSPRQTVISGDLEGINETLKLCQTAKITAIQLKVSQAFHSKFVAGAGSKLA
ncbi:MAG: beta-ketoacyl synthase N-terminal-like domain-containing protein, partial [Promethearchaeota archaeon]